MEKRGAENQRQHARDLLVDAESEKPQQAEADQRAQDADQNIRAVADENIAHGGIGVVIVKRRQPLDVGADDVRGKHQQRLADAVPAVELAVASVDAKVRVVLADQRAARKSRRSAWPAGDGPCRSSQARPTARRTPQETPRGPREMRGCETSQDGARGGQSSWLAHPSPRPRWIQAEASALASNTSRSKSCRDFQGSLRYSHAGVAEWQTRRTQNPLVARPCGFDSLLRHQHFFATEQAIFIARYSI